MQILFMDYALTLSPVWLAPIFMLLLVYIYGTWPYSQFKQLGIGGPKPVPFAGNIFQVMSPEGMHKVIKKWKKRYGEVFGFYLAREPYLVIADLDMLKEIFVKKFNCFPNRRATTIRQEPLSSGLAALRDQKWKYVRTVLTPAFSAAKMKQMSVLIQQCCGDLMKNLEKYANEDKIIDFKEIFASYSNDCLLSTSFGVRVDSQNDPDNIFVKNLKKLTSLITNINLFLILRLFFPFLRPLLDFLNFKVIPNGLMDFFVRSASETIELRKSEENPRLDLMQLMLNAHEEIAEDDLEGEDRAQLSLNEILGQSLTFYLAGYETTSTMLAYAVYLLAVNPEVQDRLRDEVETVMQKHEVPGYEAQLEMKYLDQVCCEMLRLYPPAVSTDRQCSQDCVIGDGSVFVPKGMNIHVPIWAIHHDRKIYPNPEKFDPDRFSPEERGKYHQYSWLPFGGGPRICIGMRMAMLEAKYSLVEILQRYQIETCAETEIPPEVGKKGLLSPVNGMKLKLNKRN
ncbi:cytochrome P450 3A13-like isoform X2 [Ptychodera flava]|uniref:cytochrome P450 3A13-like isoform X2 n=1 Tax=Ptychodera flava TaxID=63121 RepID=UPI00396A6E2C